jgi:hypothetical protein
LIDAVWRVHLQCISLSVEKWSPDSEASPEFFIRHHLSDVEDCVNGRRFSRKLLRWALIDRFDMHEWCHRQGIPLPDFWFPPGWHLTYQWPEDVQSDDSSGVLAQDAERKELGIGGAGDKVRLDETGGSSARAIASERLALGDDKLRANQRARIACQVVAAGLWKREPQATIASMVKHQAIRELCGGAHYDDETVRDWIKVEAPDAVRNKRGRPPKKNPPGG